MKTIGKKISYCINLVFGWRNNDFLPPTIFVKLQIPCLQANFLDKIKGGWAGQTIGVSFGSHAEFRYQGNIYTRLSVYPMA